LAGSSGETESQRWNRNFSELLQELRVVQTGIQILFAFLLTMPFSGRFPSTHPRDRVAYVVTLITAAAATAFLVAPVSYHRLAFRQGRKPEVVRAAARLAQFGLICLLASIVGAVFLVMDVVTGLPGATATAAGVLLMCTCLWYVLPLRYVVLGPRLRRPEDPDH
jgi:putative flippase GtrA